MTEKASGKKAVFDFTPRAHLHRFAVDEGSAAFDRMKAHTQFRGVDDSHNKFASDFES